MKGQRYKIDSIAYFFKFSKLWSGIVRDSFLAPKYPTMGRSFIGFWLSSGNGQTVPYREKGS